MLSKTGQHFIFYLFLNYLLFFVARIFGLMIYFLRTVWKLICLIKGKKTNLKKILIIILINIIVIVAGINVLNRKNIVNTLQTVVMAESILPSPVDFISKLPIEGTKVDLSKKPSAPPIIIFNTWLTSGYDLQPSNQYTIVNKPKTLYVHSGAPLFKEFVSGSAQYTWYKYDDKKGWIKIDQDNDLVNENSLTVIPKKYGTVYYRHVTNWPYVINLWDNSIYSKTAFITTFDNAVDANGLDVKADNHYLYNKQEDATTFVKGTPDPSNATGNIEWKVDNSDLATVDDRGKVTAKKGDNHGVVRVTGYLKNSDGTIVEGHDDIRVGGGLDDEEVNEGEKAVFNIQGDFTQKPSLVIWHKLYKDNKADHTYKDKTLNKNGNDMSYSIPETNYKTDDDTKYYAEITISNGKENTVVTTNSAILKVIPDQSQDIKMKSTIFKKNEVNHFEGNTVLGGVAKGNELTFKLDVTDDTLNFPMVGAVISLKVPNTLDITAIRLDGQNKSVFDLSEKEDPNNNQGYIAVVKNIDFSSVRNHILEIDGTVNDIDKLDSYTSTFVFQGIKSNGVSPNELYSNPLTWYLDDNLVSLEANNWQYPTVNSTSKARLLRRLKMTDKALNITNNALNIIDNRTDKKSAQVYLKQRNPFKSGNNILAAEIRYYRKNGGFTKLDNDGIIAEETKDGETLKSIAWSPDEGPLLYIYGGDKKAGTYSTGLEWSLVQSIPNTNTPTKINS